MLLTGWELGAGETQRGGRPPWQRTADTGLFKSEVGGTIILLATWIIILAETLKYYYSPNHQSKIQLGVGGGALNIRGALTGIPLHARAWEGIVLS